MRALIAALLGAVLIAVHPYSAADDQLRMRLRQRPATGGSCTFPSCFPDATNTGYAPTGVTLTTYVGPTTITTNNTTIDSKEITSCLTIHANNVTISRSWMHPSSDCSYLIDSSAGDSFGSTGLLVVDTTFTCRNSFGFVETAIADSNYTLRRSDVSRCDNGSWVENDGLPSGVISIEESYIHNLKCYNASDPHVDAVQIAGGAHHVTLQHNRLYGTCDAGIAGGGGDGSSSISGGFNTSFITVNQNLIAGGGYALYCDQEDHGTEGAGDSWTNNHFSNLFRTEVGFFGPTALCGDEGAKFSGNTCHESGASLTASTGSCPSPPDPIALLVHALRFTMARLSGVQPAHIVRAPAFARVTT